MEKRLNELFARVNVLKNKGSGESRWLNGIKVYTGGDGYNIIRVGNLEIKTYDNEGIDLLSFINGAGDVVRVAEEEVEREIELQGVVSEMTVSEISEALGKTIKVIADKTEKTPF